MSKVIIRLMHPLFLLLAETRIDRLLLEGKVPDGQRVCVGNDGKKGELTFAAGEEQAAKASIPTAVLPRGGCR